MKEKMNFFVVIFFGLYLILPSYCALEITSSLPLITVSRIILIVLIGAYILQHKGIINLKIFEDKRDRKFFIIYFILLIIANIYFVGKFPEALKKIFSIIFEEILVLWIVVKCIDSKVKLEKALKIMLFASSVVAVLAMVSSVTGNNVFYYLNTVNRKMLMAETHRMGLVRAEAGFGHPICYGIYCLIMIIISTYFIENEQKGKKYYVCFGLNFIALMLSNSRGSILAGLCIGIYMILNKGTKKLGKYVGMFGLVLIFIIIVGIVNPKIFKFTSDIWTSITNVFSSETKEISDYGANEGNGMESRTNQISQTMYALKENFLFGQGASAQTRGVLRWFNPKTNKWSLGNTFDVEYLAVPCQYGLIGTIGQVMIYIYILKNIFNRKYKKDNLMQLFKYCFIAYFICLFASTGVNDLFWIMLALMVSYKNILLIGEENSE